MAYGSITMAQISTPEPSESQSAWKPPKRLGLRAKPYNP